MKTIVSAAPFANLLGIQDVSGRAPVYEPEAVPTHLPHVYIYAQKGPTLPQLASGDAFQNMFGHKTLDTRSPYYNHQSVLAGELMRKGNACMFERIVPANAGPKARLLLSLDIVEDQIQQYERNADGSFRRNASGAKIPTGAPVTGYKAKWVLNDWLVGGTPEAFGAVNAKVGSLVSTTSVQSTVYPILELEANFIGAYGNGLGLRFMAPTSESGIPMNTTVAEAVKAFLYRAQLVERADASTSPVTLETLFGEQFVDFSFKAGAVNTALDTELDIQSVLLQSYEDIEARGEQPKYGPFGRMKVYNDNLETLLALIGEAEAPFGLFPETTMDADSEYLHMVNPFTGVDFNGVPYYSLQLLGPADGGILFSENSVHYAAGASDGTMSNEDFDLAVRTKLLSYGQGEAQLLDDAVYPQSCIYDTGFSLDTKKAMGTVLGRRKDMYIVVSTQDITQPQNSASDESAIAVALRAAFQNFPESEMFGTGVCRAIIIGHSGYLTNHKYKGLLPLTIEFASKCADYMGAANGIWQGGMGFDQPGNNLITMFRDVNVTFKAGSVRNKDWDNGLVWVQNYDRRSLFWPAVQTVYDDDSSVLNAALNMIVCVELEKVAQRTWRDLSGISNLSNDQFIERSNRLIEERTAGRFDGRVTIEAETYLTAADEQRGYSWSTKIHMYGENMKTVGTYTVVAHRSSDLNTAP